MIALWLGACSAQHPAAAVAPAREFAVVHERAVEALTQDRHVLGLDVRVTVRSAIPRTDPRHAAWIDAAVRDYARATPALEAAQARDRYALELGERVRHGLGAHGVDTLAVDLVRVTLPPALSERIRQQQALEQERLRIDNERRAAEDVARPP